jgi:hypothetical protein
MDHDDDDSMDISVDLFGGSEFVADNRNSGQVRQVVVAGKQQVKVTASDEDIIKVYQLLNIPITDLNKKFVQNWRVDTVHIRGVQNLSSDNVLEYFAEYDPASLEWVTDMSCNVVFDDARSAATALIGLMTSLLITRPKSGSDDDMQDSYGVPVVDGATLAIPIPPGTWLKANDHPSAKVLLLRLANHSDKKMRNNGEKDNENYVSDVKELLSDNRIRRVRERINTGASDEDKASSSKILRMRMRADDVDRKAPLASNVPNLRVEVPIKRGGDDGHDDRVGSVWKRLEGVSQRSKGIQSKKSAKPKLSRGNVWSRIAIAGQSETTRNVEEPMTGRGSVWSRISVAGAVKKRSTLAGKSVHDRLG